MDFNIEVRKKQLQSLDQYISSSKDKVQSILDCLGWSAENLKKQEDELVTCSFNKNHRIHSKRAVEHVKNCQIKKEGYDLDEPFLSEPLNHAVGSIKIDPFIKIQVLTKARMETPNFRTAWNGTDPDPRTSDRVFSTFSSSERLALYDFCVQHTKGPPVPPEIHSSIGDTENKTLTENELRALQRDSKRRQVKHKSVHTNRKTYTEVMRQVIENQMTLYEEWIEQSKATINRNNSNVEKDFSLSDDAEMSNNIGTKIKLETNDNIAECPSTSTDYDPHNEDTKYQSELEKSEKLYDKERRRRSPSEHSNTSSNRSRRRDDRYSRNSRHSSLESSKSYHRHSDEKYKRRTSYRENEGYRKHSDGDYRKHRDEDCNKHRDEDYNKRPDVDHIRHQDEDYIKRRDEDYNKRRDEDYNKRREDYKKTREEKYYNRRDEEYNRRRDEAYKKHRDEDYKKNRDDDCKERRDEDCKERRDEDYKRNRNDEDRKHQNEDVRHSKSDMRYDKYSKDTKFVEKYIKEYRESENYRSERNYEDKYERGSYERYQRDRDHKDEFEKKYDRDRKNNEEIDRQKDKYMKQEEYKRYREFKRSRSREKLDHTDHYSKRNEDEYLSKKRYKYHS